MCILILPHATFVKGIIPVFESSHLWCGRAFMMSRGYNLKSTTLTLLNTLAYTQTTQGLAPFVSFVSKGRKLRAAASVAATNSKSEKTSSVYLEIMGLLQGIFVFMNG